MTKNIAKNIIKFAIFITENVGSVFAEPVVHNLAKGSILLPIYTDWKDLIKKVNAVV